jgi:UPF0755 protein
VAESRERTTAEREAARLERERRRAGRLAEPEPGVDGRAAAGVDGGEPTFDGEQESDNASVRTQRRGEEPVPAEPAEVRGLPAEPIDEHELLGDSTDEHELLDDSTDEHELPAGTRRVARHERIAAAPRPPRRTPRPVRRSTGTVGGGSKHSLGGRVLGVLAVVGAVAAVWFLVELFQPFHSSGHAPVTVTIPRNSSAGTIGNLLERNGVISSSFFFELRATIAGERGGLRSGTYHLKQGMSYGDVLKILTTAPPAAKVSNLTIVEGKTRPEIHALLRSQGVRGSYLAATRHSRLLDPRRYGAPRSTSSLEGFLFPSTYQLRDPISISALVDDQLRTFRQEFKHVDLGFARRKNLTPYDVLTIASMVQAEAQTAHDRPLIASVIYNRLAAGMPLQIDATTRFATGNYTKPLTVSQLSSGSPYNTRIHKGLPPGPIDSPGLASIQAAAHPARSNYVFFVVKTCGNGEHVFESSYSKFLADVQRYQTARASRGGRSPSHC